MMNISFETIENKQTISILETEWRNSLTFPNDDYWATQFESCQYWALKLAEKVIGYACISRKNVLYNFYITPKYLVHGVLILEEFLRQRDIKKGEVGTNNPICLSLIMHFQKSIEIDSYIFKDMEEVGQEEREIEFRIAQPDEVEALVDFEMGGLQPSVSVQNWFRTYVRKWISRDGLFVLKNGHKIIGLLEVRTTALNTKIASLGISVLEEFRNQGYGTYLLIKGKAIAKSRNLKPICGCKKTNIASLKVIEKSGFRKLHLSLLIHL